MRVNLIWGSKTGTWIHKDLGGEMRIAGIMYELCLVQKLHESPDEVHCGRDGVR